jgi:hypothetical protein
MKYLSIILAGFSAILSIGGAALFYGYQAAIQGARLWPLPGLVLLVWLLLGVGVLVSVLLSRREGGKYIEIPWALSGAMIPYAILGTFSIGTLVFIAFLFGTGASINLTSQVQRTRKWLSGVVFLAIGAVANSFLFLFFLWLQSLLTNAI